MIKRIEKTIRICDVCKKEVEHFAIFVDEVTIARLESESKDGKY